MKLWNIFFSFTLIFICNFFFHLFFAQFFLSLCERQKSSLYKDILENDQHDPNLIKFISEGVIKPPSGVEYNLKQPNRIDYSQYREGEFLFEYFKNKNNGIFIESGAYDGETFSNTLILERKLGWRGLLVEPNPFMYQQIDGKKRNVFQANCCLSLTSRSSEVTISINRARTHVIMDSDPEKGEKLVKVKCYPLYSLMVATNFTTVDFLSLDVESVEVKVLETIPWHDVDIKTILVEVNLIPEGKDFVKQYLENKNYEFIKEIKNNYFFAKKN